MKSGEHVRFWMWHHLRCMLYGYNGMQRYKSVLFKANEPSDAGHSVGQGMLEAKYANPALYDSYFKMMANGAPVSTWDHFKERFHVGGASYSESPESYMLLETDGYLGGEIHFLDIDNELLARMPMTSARGGVSADDRFDFPYPKFNPGDSEYYKATIHGVDEDSEMNMNPETLSFSTRAPKLHAIVRLTGRPTWFRFQACDSAKMNVPASASNPRYLMIGTIGLKGSGSDIELELSQLDWEQGKIIRFTKLELEFANAVS